MKLTIEPTKYIQFSKVGDVYFGIMIKDNGEVFDAVVYQECSKELNPSYVKLNKRWIDNFEVVEWKEFRDKMLKIIENN